MDKRNPVAPIRQSLGMPPFTTAQADERFTPRGLRTALASGTVRRLFQGVYADAEDPDSVELRAAAIRLIRPAGVTVAYLRTAAWLHGLDVLPPRTDVADWPIQLAVESGRTKPRIRGCEGHEAPLPDHDFTEVLGIPVTTRLRTALDCGRLLPRLEAVAAVDQFVHAEPNLRGQLRSRVAEFERMRGRRQLDFVAEIADPRVESVGESWNRVVLVDGGLPIPEPQIVVYDEAGYVVARIDNGYREYLVGVEYDGDEHHDGRENRLHDEARRERLRRAGWMIIVARREHIWRDQEALIAAVADALAERGLDVSGLSPKRSTRAA